MSFCWFTSYIGYPNFFKKAGNPFELAQSFLKLAKAAQADQSYADAKDLFPDLDYAQVETKKAAFQEFGLLYVVPRSNVITLTPVGKQIYEECLSSDLREKNKRFILLALSHALARYQFNNPLPVGGNRGIERAQSTDVLPYLACYYLLRKLNGLITVSEIRGAIFGLQQMTDINKLVSTIADKRQSKTAFKDLPSLPVNKGTADNLKIYFVSHLSLDGEIIKNTVVNYYGSEEQAFELTGSGYEIIGSILDELWPGWESHSAPIPRAKKYIDISDYFSNGVGQAYTNVDIKEDLHQEKKTAINISNGSQDQNEDSIKEEVSVEPEGIDSTVKLMDKPFNPALINIENKLLNIDLLIKRIRQSEPEIELNTESYFQRKADLWNIEQQSRLIESILIRFPLPAFYFDGSDQNKWLVVDGLQRLSSIRNFVVDKKLKLTNLEFLVQLNGKGYDDLDRDLQRIIEETQVVAYIINPGTPADVKFNIFKRINTGGLVLEPQEIRHALNQGEPAKFIMELASTTEFKKATSGAISIERMLDRDFANRFLSFYLFGYENYTPDLDTFMSKAMAHVNNMSKDDRLKCKKDFINSMNLNYDVFGKYAFRKIGEEGEKRKPLNKALFDVFSVIFSRYDEVERNMLVNKRKEVIRGLINLLTQDEAYFWAVTNSTSDKKRIVLRFVKTENMIKDVLKN